MKMLEGKTCFKIFCIFIETKMQHNSWYTIPTYNKKDEGSLLPDLFLIVSMWLVLLFRCRLIMRPELFHPLQSSLGKWMPVASRTKN